MKALNYLKFSKHILFKKNSLPLYFVLFVTDHCEANCKHCLLGENHGTENELTLDEYEKISENEDLYLLEDDFELDEV